MYLTGDYSTHKLSESELISRCRMGEEQAFSEIIRRFRGRIGSTVTGMLGRCPEAEDVAQEVFIRFYNAINNFREESSLSTYLTRIAINLSLNEIRRRKVRQFLSFEKMLEEGHDIPDASIKDPGDDKKELVYKAIEKLSAKYKAVLVLRLIDDYSTEETAKILSLPVGTVLSRLARAQNKLREYLKSYKYEI